TGSAVDRDRPPARIAREAALGGRSAGLVDLQHTIRSDGRLGEQSKGKGDRCESKHRKLPCPPRKPRGTSVPGQEFRRAGLLGDGASDEEGESVALRDEGARRDGSAGDRAYAHDDARGGGRHYADAGADAWRGADLVRGSRVLE